MSGRETGVKSKKDDTAKSAESHPKTNGEVAVSGDFDVLIESDAKPCKKERPTKHDSGAADLEKVTDYAEETEISSKGIEGVRINDL